MGLLERNSRAGVESVDGYGVDGQRQARPGSAVDGCAPDSVHAPIEDGRDEPLEFLRLHALGQQHHSRRRAPEDLEQNAGGVSRPRPHDEEPGGEGGRVEGALPAFAPDTIRVASAHHEDHIDGGASMGAC
ncbi:MAG: hypothetical protein QOK42_1175 [Frankiaceae bacterium]|nr:hypothetical protein [Frankiaceae bacterium]MDX6273194.1 hypothetical protein [Frankiales bacterium]